jgi:hypothetical protein
MATRKTSIDSDLRQNAAGDNNRLGAVTDPFSGRAATVRNVISKRVTLRPRVRRRNAPKSTCVLGFCYYYSHSYGDQYSISDRGPLDGGAGMQQR